MEEDIMSVGFWIVASLITTPLSVAIAVVIVQWSLGEGRWK